MPPTVKVKNGKKTVVLQLGGGGLKDLREAMRGQGMEFEGKKLIMGGKVLRMEDEIVDKSVVMVGGVDEGWEEDVTEDDEEIARAIAMSLEEEEKEKELKEVEFERFDSENIQIDDDTLTLINQYHSTDNPYVDPQFCPTAKSIYLNPSDATSWVCSTCNNPNPLPDLRPPPTSQAEVDQQNMELQSTKCQKCPNKPTHVQQVNIVNRPSTWLRPGVRCQDCDAYYRMQGVRDVTGLTSRQCTHFLRDDITSNTTGNTWKVIREAARPEDVYQGALGNCWFGGALSCVAAKPELVDRLLITKEYNPIGAYIVQLFHSGGWRKMLIDDTFPCSKPWDGRIDPNGTIYFSRGGHPCYAKPARQSLWVPLVEKACAKLFGSYGALSGGTMGEALQLLTGYACENHRLSVPPELKARRMQRREQIQAYRMAMLLQGKPAPNEENPESDEDDDDEDILWSKLLSASEAGYIMGMACSAEAVGSTREKYVEELGLQTPHAYGILQLKEVTVEGKVHRLVQCRNPWGERAPRTWKGAWGKDWSGWTRELKIHLGVTNHANVKMYDEMSIFWMCFSDVKKYFVAVDVCRVHPVAWRHVTATGWLPSELSPGSTFTITVPETTLADIILWQEKHIARESTLQAFSSNVDIGFAVAREASDGSWVTVEYERREVADQVSVEVVLHGGCRYKVVPWCVGLMQAGSEGRRLRKVGVGVYSEKRIVVEEGREGWEGHAAVLAGVKGGKVKTLCPGVTVKTVKETVGLLAVVENTTDEEAVVQFDVNATNCTSTRPQNAFSTITTLPPHTRHLTLALTYNTSTRGSSYGYSFDSLLLPATAAGFAVPPDPSSVHQLLPIPPPPTFSPPNPKIVDLFKEEEEATERAALEEAIKMSMEVDGEEEEDDELQAAIKMSMEGGEGEAQGEQDDELRKALEMSMMDEENN